MNGLNNPIKRSKMIAKIREKINIAFWQETHLSEVEPEKLKLGFRNMFFSSYRNGKKRGVAILIPNLIEFEFISEISERAVSFWSKKK